MIAFGAWLGKQEHQRSWWLLLSGLLAIGCVSLAKPSEVQTCASNGTCSDDASNLPRSDAKKDAENGLPDAGRDVADAVIADADASPDVAVPDLANDNVAGPDLSLAEMPDRAPDKSTGAEPGPEPLGAEPSAGPELGPEPTAGPEPGPEPGRESGQEPGPEPGPEPQRDAAPADSATTAACANATPITGGSVVTNTTNAFCFVTCDGMEWGWGCSSFNETDRPVKVNGVSVICGGQLPAKKSGYYYFEIGPGGETWDQIHYSGTAATSCPKPTGGFSP
jgi:hypothetical protein